MSKSIKLHWQSWLFLGVLCWLLVATAYHGAINPNSGITGIDYFLYHRAAAWLNAGEKLYSPGDPERMGYMYAPAVALALRPLARLPYESALKVWFLINAASVALAVVFYALAARLRWRHAAALGLLLLIAFRYWPTTCSFGLGQINGVLLAFVGAMLFADSRGKFWAVGVLIAAAALIKLWMIAALIHLGVRRAWGAIAVCFVTFAALLAGSFALVGWHEWPGFVQTITSPNASVQPGLVSQSILGFARLRFTALGLVEPFSTDPLVHHAFVAIGFLIVGSALAWLMWQGASRTPYETRLRFSFAIVSMLLLLPLCHMEYYVFALPLLWTLLIPGPGARIHPATIIAGIVVYGIFTRPVPVSGPGLATHHDGLQSLLVSQPFFAAVLLWCVAFAEICRVRAAQGVAVAATQPIAFTGRATVTA